MKECQITTDTSQNQTRDWIKKRTASVFPWYTIWFPNVSTRMHDPWHIFELMNSNIIKESMWLRKQSLAHFLGWVEYVINLIRPFCMRRVSLPVWKVNLAMEWRGDGVTSALLEWLLVIMTATLNHKSMNKASPQRPWSDNHRERKKFLQLI